MVDSATIYSSPSEGFDLYSLRDKLESLITTRVPRFFGTHKPQLPREQVHASYNGVNFADCWTYTATIGTSQRTRVLNMLKDNSYTFWEEVVIYEEPASPPSGGGSPNQNAPRRKLSSSGGRSRAPRFTIRKSAGTWQVTRDGKSILLEGVGYENSGECGDYEEDLSPRGVDDVDGGGKYWIHEEVIGIESLFSDWCSVSEHKVNELLV